MKKRILSGGDGYALTFSEEDGKHYQGTHMDIAPVMDHVKKVRELHSQATKQSNPNEWRHVGTVPIPIITDWCKRNGYTFSQWARNEDRAKDKFLSYFMSRDFAKLHNNHVTTRRESSQIVVPKSIAREAVDLSGVLP